MSTFFVASATIDATVAGIIAAEGPLSLDAATALGQTLWAINAEAVRWRYDLDAGTPEERAEHKANLAEIVGYVWTPRDLTLAVTVKSLDCLHTQCCEGPLRDTALYGRLTALVNHHDASGVRETEEYERAPWGIEDAASPAEAPPAAAPMFRSELTPEGEQLVIPGCERNLSKTLRQLDLFG